MPRRDDIPLDDRLPGGSHAPGQGHIVRRAPSRGGPVEDRPPTHEHDDEGPSSADLERFGGVTVSCPHCRAELYDDSALCWKCGRALAEESPAKLPAWVVVIAAALLILAITGILLRVL